MCAETVTTGTDPGHGRKGRLGTRRHAFRTGDISALGAAVEQDPPALDAHRAQQLRLPRVDREARADLLLARRVDDVQHPRSVTERAAQDDEPLLGERVHERGVLVPALLLAQVAGCVPARPALTR